MVLYVVTRRSRSEREPRLQRTHNAENCNYARETTLILRSSRARAQAHLTFVYVAVGAPERYTRSTSRGSSSSSSSSSSNGGSGTSSSKRDLRLYVALVVAVPERLYTYTVPAYTAAAQHGGTANALVVFNEGLYRPPRCT
ncbi:unnamed protein product [Trichogramma brassicae]|uniref:Uncharacterized protein n=1 Tax=Trichogramma brassicae TaxID=86971 RepID=A0A6H5IKH8_9HYME|nr:unnamed protein product [Trichogramma brassicae]